VPCANTFLDGLATQLVFLKREKLHLSAIIDELEDLAEVRLLSSDEIELKSLSNAQITNLLCAEELKWYQRSKAQLILEGDSNTHYFHGIANGRHRKKMYSIFITG
jgi:hypothetical protein